MHGCLRIFADEVSSVLQLVSRNGCHKFNHGKAASPLENWLFGAPGARFWRQSWKWPFVDKVYTKKHILIQMWRIGHLELQKRHFGDNPFVDVVCHLELQKQHFEASP